MIKSLSLSFDEIRQLIEISDPEHRRQVLQSLTETETADPTASEINPDAYADSHPMALRLVQKIRRKTKAALQRQRRQQKAESIRKKALPEQQSIEISSDDSVTIELNDATDYHSTPRRIRPRFATTFPFISPESLDNH